MDTRVRHESLLLREIEERAVRDTGLLRGLARIRGPGVKVSIKVYNRDGPVDLVQRSQNRQYDCMIAAKTVNLVSISLAISDQ